MLKRLVDVGVASVALTWGAPVYAAIGLAIWRDMGRPVLFRQRRAGLHGRPFEVVKFRSMRDALGPDGEPLPDGERITELGAWLRKTGLDELPELWNVLKGEMSLVGPRPLLEEYLELYTPRQARRHEVKPGIAGLAVIEGDLEDWERRFELDVRYVEEQSLLLDLKILLRTLLLVAGGRSGQAKADGHHYSEKFRGSPA